MKNNKKAGIVSTVVLSALAALGNGQALATGGHGHEGNEGGNSSASAGSTSISHGSNVSVTGLTTNVGGQSTSVGGQTTTVGPQSATQSSSLNNATTNTTNYRAPIMTGYAPVFMSPSGECGVGWGISLSGPWSGLGFGKASQDEHCLAQRFNMTLSNLGAVMMNNGFVEEGANALSTSMRAQAEISQTFDKASKLVSANELLPCVQQAKKRPSITVMAQELECDTQGNIAIKKPVPVIKAAEPAVSY